MTFRSFEALFRHNHQEAPVTAQPESPVLPEGWTLDPAVTEHRPEIGLWWVILPNGQRVAWNNEPLECPVCHAKKPDVANCEVCVGRGFVGTVPFAERPWDEVVDGLWLGGHDCQPDGYPPRGDCLITPEHGFDLVVSLYKRLSHDFAVGRKTPDERFDPPSGVTHMYHQMADGDLDPAHHTRLDELAAHVEDAVRHGDKVLVRCQAGLNRSALVTGLALMKMGWKAADAISWMREVRSPYVLFNRDFTDHLHAVEARRG
jgi:protein-tyrosine phosphatase